MNIEQLPDVIACRKILLGSTAFIVSYMRPAANEHDTWELEVEITEGQGKHSMKASGVDVFQSIMLANLMVSDYFWKQGRLSKGSPTPSAHVDRARFIVLEAYGSGSIPPFFDNSCTSLDEFERRADEWSIPPAMCAAAIDAAKSRSCFYYSTVEVDPVFAVVVWVVPVQVGSKSWNASAIVIDAVGNSSHFSVCGVDCMHSVMVLHHSVKSWLAMTYFENNSDAGMPWRFEMLPGTGYMVNSLFSEEPLFPSDPGDCE